jgi:hypothetical protein
MSMSEERLLRLQLERDLAMHEAAGRADLAKAVKVRLADLDKSESAPKKTAAAKKEEEVK